MSEMLFKDAVLDELAKDWNVAQFVSFGPTPELAQRFSRVHGQPPNKHFQSVNEAIATLMAESPESSLNVRSFDPSQPKSSEFSYGLRTIGAVIQKLTQHAGAGLYTIVNETVDVSDGGVSGVVFGDVVEFAPGDTPRAVEKAGTASLPFDLALRLHEAVYGFKPAVMSKPGLRLEFSTHPMRRGVRHEHTILWEAEHVDPVQLQPYPTWPNRFSRLVGDKAFGLLIGHLLGLPVPTTTVITRTVAPFRFGAATHTGEWWIRTCPREQVPGRYSTHYGWADPFLLLASEDPDGSQIASILAQEGVEPVFSGALLVDAGGEPVIEGVKGTGEGFMVGNQPPEPLPVGVTLAVRQLFESAARVLGPVRLEWVFDGSKAWIVQLHSGQVRGHGATLYPGEADIYRRFEVTQGLEPLRALIADIGDRREGIILVGNVGVTSHFGDVLRKARIPSKMEAAS
jgi:hypothetical protein